MKVNVKTRWISVITLATLLFLVGIGSIRALYAQATTGYTKVNTTPITTLTFTSPTLVDGTVVNVEITAVNAAGESIPSSIVSGVVPATGTHTFTATWPPTTGAI